MPLYKLKPIEELLNTPSIKIEEESDMFSVCIDEKWDCMPTEIGTLKKHLDATYNIDSCACGCGSIEVCCDYKSPVYISYHSTVDALFNKIGD